MKDRWINTTWKIVEAQRKHQMKDFSSDVSGGCGLFYAADLEHTQHATMEREGEIIRRYGP